MKQRLLELIRRRPAWTAAAALALVAALIWAVRGSSAPRADTSWYEARRGDFLISIVEGGNLEAVREVVIRSQFEGTARIIYIIAEGTYVKKGDLLVELDSANAQDSVNEQQIGLEKAQFARIQAQQQLDIEKSVVDSEVAAARLKVEFAQSDLDKYVKGEALQTRRNAEIEITNVLEVLQIADERLTWSEELFKQGFESKGNLDKDRLTVSQEKLKLEQARQQLWMIETFDEPKKRRQLEAALQEAEEELERVKLQGERRLAQYQADVLTQQNTLDLSRRKLERDQKQLAGCRITAPQDGLVVYPTASGRFSSESLIEEGATVRNRQELIKLPDLADMKLKINVHESHVGKLRIGQQAFVVLDALPDRRFQGRVNKVGLVPDTQSRFGNPNLKLYATEILITEPLPDVKPGVSARAEIVVTNLADVVTIPLQAVTTRKGRQVVFLASAPRVPVPVELGLYNTKFIQIAAGVRAGERVLLSPPFDAEEKDLGGSVIVQGEKLPPAATNVAALAAVPVLREPGGEGAPAPDAATGPRGGRGGGGRAERGGNGPPDAGAAGREEFARDVGGIAQADGPTGAGEGEGDPARAERRNRQGGGPRFNREEMMKQFDADGDGELSEEERNAMRASFRNRGGGGRTNAPAGAPPAGAPPAPVPAP